MLGSTDKAAARSTFAEGGELLESGEFHKPFAHSRFAADPIGAVSTGTMLVEALIRADETETAIQLL